MREKEKVYLVEHLSYKANAKSQVIILAKFFENAGILLCLFDCREREFWLSAALLLIFERGCLFFFDVINLTQNEWVFLEARE